MKELLTIEDLAKMTGLSERTIRNYLAGGQLEGEELAQRRRRAGEDGPGHAVLIAVGAAQLQPVDLRHQRLPQPMGALHNLTYTPPKK